MPLSVVSGIFPARERDAAQRLPPEFAPLDIAPQDLARQSALIDPLGIYASAMDTSDYIAAVAPTVRAHITIDGTLLDVGAGGGQLGHALCNPAKGWSAIEPAALMRKRLGLLSPPPAIIPTGWEDADVAPASHDFVLAATMPALFTNSDQFLAQCHTWARKAVIWIVPAMHGPKGLILAGCLPREWHNEDETPGLEICLRHLSKHRHPPVMQLTHWTFSAVVADIAVIAHFLADRLRWRPDDPRRAEMRAHLSAQAKPDALGFRLEIPRTSAILIWSL